ncbi:phosphate acetyltransferase [Virgibacillus dakarensis]|uniref:Phosphate acetyltransferase n=1 Tax=Lentibacillus populi TaxID=1827502 RepID=A0A9W5TVF3_9BACI|nr:MULTISPECIES: phosphate acetyltransferase [Bacillaceae]MBT2215266.1 phosphate acetyltransferase [Virgibacillus dakarensis]MTW86095.1 phosphate acetyltransferase [Virgibacillus dakarensis]GGB35001.1 phosphate acetyltransferase [Lentibacillus populi]
MSNLFTEIANTIADKNKHIVFPEGTDQRILEAASKLGAAGILTPILIGNKAGIKHTAEEVGVDVSSCKLIDPAEFQEYELMVETFVERRKGKATTEEAREILQDENYFGTMLVYMNQADGLVSGAIHSTADTVRPALQIIKTKEGIKKTSGVFIMVRGEEKYVFADCAINIAPDSQDLAEIAVASAETATLFDIDPRVAMLSFSTKGSAKSEETEKVAAAVRLAKEKNANLLVDGEFQFDAAFVPSVARKKAPDSVLAGNANVFIFPSLEAGNISYKIAQRLGGFEAVGPILQGLNQPVNDLSRGCSADDVYKLALITAAQAE